jgi:hypothetical protein
MLDDEDTRKVISSVFKSSPYSSSFLSQTLAQTLECIVIIQEMCVLRAEMMSQKLKYRHWCTVVQNGRNVLLNSYEWRDARQQIVKPAANRHLCKIDTDDYIEWKNIERKIDLWLERGVTRWLIAFSHYG